MRPRRFAATLAFGILALAVLPMAPASACSCVHDEEGKRPLSGTVFYGDILRREVSGTRATYVVAVKRVYSGSTGPVARVRSHRDGATCGLELPSSGPAVFFAREEDGELRANLCGGSRTAADGPPTKLGRGRPPAAETGGSPAASPPASPGESPALPIAAAAIAVAGAAALVVPRRSPRP